MCCVDRLKSQSLAALEPNTSLMSAFGRKPDTRQLDFESPRLNVRFRPEAAISWRLGYVSLGLCRHLRGIIGRPKAAVEVGMKTTHVVASELFLVLLLAGCANLPPDQACRAGLENEYEVLDANGRTLRYHRSPYFAFLLSAAEDTEINGDYQSCLSILKMARNHSHESSGNNWTRTTYSWRGQNQSSRGSGIDAAHHARGHTHHHGHN